MGVVGGTAGPGEALFQTPGLCSDSALDLGKRIRPCSCQGGLDPRTGSSFQNSPEQGVQMLFLTGAMRTEQERVTAELSSAS